MHENGPLVTVELPPSAMELARMHSAHLAYPELFEAVASARPHEYDCKLDVDSTVRDHAALQEDIAALGPDAEIDEATAFDLWEKHFEPPKAYEVTIAVELGEVVSPETKLTLSEYISKTWKDLTYHVKGNLGTLLGTEFPHLKSGRRYAEGYYWDVSDGLEGLVIEAQTDPEKWDLVMGVLKNCRNMIRDYGFIPNGMRSYYLTRSQPPKFASMIKTVARYRPEVVEEFLPEVVQEYNWWMKGSADLDAERGIRASDHVVMMPDGSVLNRFWDMDDTPRPEGHKKDLKTAEGLDETTRRRLFRNLRIIAASGRDFTAEYLDDPTDLSTACADRIMPVDLNSLLWEYEDFIATAHSQAGRTVPAKEYRNKAQARADAINKYMWVDHKDGGYYSGFKFDDYSYRTGNATGFKSMTTAYPVARGIAPIDRAKEVCGVLVNDLLKPGGFVGSTADSKQQWDAPNGWAPDQNEGVNALDKTAERLHELVNFKRNMGFMASWSSSKRQGLKVAKMPETWDMLMGSAIDDLRNANKLQVWGNVARARWVGRHARIYSALGKIVEKCNVVDRNPLAVQDGEYPLQDGFLWTNGILRKFLHHLGGVQLPEDCARHLQRVRVEAIQTTQ